MIMVLIYNLADTFFIGQTKNALMVAAVSVATPVVSPLVAMLKGRETLYSPVSEGTKIAEL